MYPVLNSPLPGSHLTRLTPVPVSRQVNRPENVVLPYQIVSVPTAGYGSASLSLWRFIDSGLDGSECPKIEALAGSSWNTLYHWFGNNGGDNNTWHRETRDLTSYLTMSGSGKFR